MKNIKDITLSIFAIIGFVAIVSGFTNNETEETESLSNQNQDWEIVSGGALTAFKLNKVTGEVWGYYLSGAGAKSYRVYKTPIVVD